MSWSLISLFVGIIGVIVALYQSFEKKRLSHYLRSQSWYIYSMSLLSWNAAQTALIKYKDSDGQELNPDIFESLSKCDAYNLSLSLEAIRQIQLSEPHFDNETITTWATQGKIPKDHTALFLRILSFETPGTLCLLWKSFTARLSMKLQKKKIQQSTIVIDSQKDTDIENKSWKL